MLIFNCPACKRRLRMPEAVLDKSLRCPACAAVFTATRNWLESVPSVRRQPDDNVGVRAGEVQPLSADDNQHRPDIESRDVSRSVTLFVKKPQKGKLRKYMAWGCGTVAFSACAVGWGADLVAGKAQWDGFSIVAALGGTVLIFPVGLAVGAVFGMVIETLVRLFRLRSGESVLLALAGDTEESGPVTQA
jgi:hypothetical protein